MKEHPEAVNGATPEAHPIKNFQERFNEELERWRDEGCHFETQSVDDLEKVRCGGRPHLTKILPKDNDGNVTMSVGCEHGHEDIWRFKVAEKEMQEELAKQAEAAKKAEAQGGMTRDPMKASVKITMDLKTQQVQIEPWVPTPGMGLQLAAILTSHFSAELQRMSSASHLPNLKLPPKGILHPRTGKPLNQ